MTAQIISLLDHRNRKAAAEASPVSAAVAGSQPPTQKPAAAPIARIQPRATAEAVPTIVAATHALSTACREMAVNLAMMMSHADAACATITKIGESADALANVSAELEQAATSVRGERDRAAAELASDIR